MKRLHLLLVFSVLFGLQAMNQVNTEKLAELEKYYDTALSDWNVPGMAIAIVTKDSVLFAKGFGVIDVESKIPVDENTLFALASNTKAFTATALAMLVDQGKMNWDDKVTDYLPWFKMYDPYVTNAFTIRDLLSHRSGLETFSGDLIWYGSTYSREEVIAKAQYLKPVYGFREHFGYSNIMFIAAGEIIPAVTGEKWEDFVSENILKPLNMNRSLLKVSDLNRATNVASPHTFIENKPIVIPWMDWNNMAPAGSLISSVSDMARWLQMNLGQGIYKNDTLVSAKRLSELQSSNTLININGGSQAMFPSIHFKTYGMGWSLMDYLGRKIVSHNGGYDGMISQTVFIPEENIGFVIVTNANSTLYYPMMYKTLDVLLGNPEVKDWSKMILSRIKTNEEQAKVNKAVAEAARNKQSKPSLDINAYTGFYGCDLYDSVKVFNDNGALSMQYMRTKGLNGKLTHWQYDTYEIEFKAFPSLPKGYVTFKLNREGKVEEMEVFVDNPDFDFTEFKLKKLE
ncbi:MAG: serine hydrolase [Bacteroidales bacterium]|nr:serine hydrolase [Bacteroidales bacterium]